MLMNGRMVLGHHISSYNIKDYHNFFFIDHDLSIPYKQKDVCKFIEHVGYYRRLINNFNKIETPLFVLIFKDVEFL
jgi:hypothetical protein